jgi:Flp pilus assembly protein TadB
VTDRELGVSNGRVQESRQRRLAMTVRQALAYHLAIPAAIFAVLLVVGVPVGTAFVIGMMAGCGSMALMMFRVDRHRERDNERESGTR